MFRENFLPCVKPKGQAGSLLKPKRELGESQRFPVFVMSLLIKS